MLSVDVFISKVAFYTFKNNVVIFSYEKVTEVSELNEFKIQLNSSVKCHFVNKLSPCQHHNTTLQSYHFMESR